MADAIADSVMLQFKVQVDAVLGSSLSPQLLRASLADTTWRSQMKATGEAKTQAFASRLVAAGYRGLLVRSFASGATNNDLNLVLWNWSDALPGRLTLIDDEGRLSP